MTSEVRSQCMRLLSLAKRGDEAAHRLLVDIIARDYAGMIKQFYTVDPILGTEDIKHEFYWGIWRAVSVVDERGDPIFHLAQRGQWAVKSVVTAVNKRRHGTTEKEGGISVLSLESMNWDHGSEGDIPKHGVDLPDVSVEADLQAVAEIKEDRKLARERVVRLLGHAELAPRHQEILQLVLSGRVDLTAPLSRKHLATQLGVSGQRVSQLLCTMEERFAAAEATVAAC